MTAKGIAALQKALPGCEIISDFSPAAGDADRKAAVWVLSLGGSVLIDDGQEQDHSGQGSGRRPVDAAHHHFV